MFSRCFARKLRYTTCVRGISRNVTTSQRAFSCEDGQSVELPYDVVISGGGIVGVATAAALAHDPMFAGRRLVLLEAAPQRPPPLQLDEVFSNRVCAVNQGSVDFLTSIGAWQHVQRACPVKQLQVWESCSDARITFDKDNLLGNVAYIVENNVILDALYKSLDAVEDCDVKVMYKSKVGHYLLPTQNADANVEVHLHDGEALNAKLLIGADGINSLVRKTIGMNYISWNYDNMALVAMLHLHPTDNTVAWQRFLPSGPIAILPLSSTRSCLIWSTRPQHAKRLLAMDDEEFVDSLNKSLWDTSRVNASVQQLLAGWDNILSSLQPTGSGPRQLPPSIVGIDENSRAAFPLGLGHASRYVGQRAAIVGDAAHRVHPLAGLGVNMGFGDAEALRQVLSRAIYNGSDVGHLNHLLDYETDRQRHNVPVMMTIDALYRLYTTDLLPVVLLRSLGLSTVNGLAPLKKLILDQAVQ